MAERTPERASIDGSSCIGLDPMRSLSACRTLELSALSDEPVPAAPTRMRGESQICAGPSQICPGRLSMPACGLGTLFDESIGSGEYSNVRALRTPSTVGESDERPTLSKSLSLSRGVSVRASDASSSADCTFTNVTSSTDGYVDARVQLTPSLSGSAHSQHLSAAHAFETRSLERLMRRSLASASSVVPLTFSLEEMSADGLCCAENKTVRDMPTPSSVESDTSHHAPPPHLQEHADLCVARGTHPVPQGSYPSRGTAAYKSASPAYALTEHGGCGEQQRGMPLAFQGAPRPGYEQRLHYSEREREERSRRERDRESTAESESGCTEIYTLKTECTRLVTRMQQGAAAAHRRTHTGDAPVRSPGQCHAWPVRLGSSPSYRCRCLRAPARRRRHRSA